MDIHKPKAIHNWRDFLKEVGTIVLGVCIALAAEQAVEWWHWRSQVQQARQVIATELAQNIAAGIYRIRTEQCVERRLDTLAEILDKASETGHLPPVGDIGASIRRTWQFGAWDSLVASQTASHFPREQLARLAASYMSVQRANLWGPIETQAWSDLNTMSGPGRRLDPASEADLRKALSIARNISRSMVIISVNTIRTADSLQLPFSTDDLKIISLARHRDLLGDNVTAQDPLPFSLVCRPMSTTVPSHYGQGQYNSLPGLMNEIIKTLPEFDKGAR